MLKEGDRVIVVQGCGGCPYNNHEATIYAMAPSDGCIVAIDGKDPNECHAGHEPDKSKYCWVRLKHVTPVIRSVL